MGEERYHQLVTEAVVYLPVERDLRGYDASLHWIHSTAHTADLLAALADSPLLTKPEASSILAAVDERLATAPEVYTEGEQDRLAATVVSVIHRQDFDSSNFEPWLDKFKKEDKDVWTRTSMESLARYQNHNYLLQALTARISLEPESGRMTDYKQKVLALLRTRLD